MASININQLNEEVERQLHLYSQNVQQVMDETFKEVAKEGLKKLKKLSPKRTKEYRKGWRVKKIDDEYVLHNHSHYRLTHLLEKGHIMKNGKRGGGSYGETKEFPHISIVENEMIRDIDRQLRRRLQG